MVVVCRVKLNIKTKTCVKDEEELHRVGGAETDFFVGI